MLPTDDKSTNFNNDLRRLESLEEEEEESRRSSNANSTFLSSNANSTATTTSILESPGAGAAIATYSNNNMTFSPIGKGGDKYQTRKQRADAKMSSNEQYKSFLRKRRQLQEDDVENNNNNNNNNSNRTPGKVEQEEELARRGAVTNPLVLFGMNLLAAIKVFFMYLVTIDTMVCNILTVGMTVFWYMRVEDNTGWSSSMNFFLVSFTVSSPITVALRMAFQRRESALICIANVRSLALHIYTAHALWDWKGTQGRVNAANEQDFDFEDHCDQVLEHLIAIGDEMTRFLTLPTFSKPRHRTLRSSRAEAVQSLRAAYHLMDSVLLQHMTRLTVLAERLKAIGLSGSEISRIRQYERHLSNQLEQLRMYKVYRTPQALWAFARIFTLFLPAFYAPTFVEVARGMGGALFGIPMGIVTATCFTALFESLQVLEDPFTAFITLDGIDVSEELEVLQWTQLINARKLLFPQCSPYPLRTKPAINMTGSRCYDPSVHYHSTPEMRELLMNKEEEQNFGLGEWDPMMAEEEKDDENFVEEMELGTRDDRTRRRSHFVPLSNNSSNHRHHSQQYLFRGASTLSC